MPVYRRLDGAGLRSYPSVAGAQAWVNDGSQLRGCRSKSEATRLVVRLNRGRPGANIDKFCEKSSCTGGLNCLGNIVQTCGSTHRLE